MTLVNFLKSVQHIQNCSNYKNVYDIFSNVGMNEFLHFQDCIHLGRYFKNNKNNDFVMTTLWKNENYVLKYCIWNNQVSKNIRNIYWDNFDYSIMKVLSGKIILNDYNYDENYVKYMCNLNNNGLILNKSGITHTLHYFKKK
jgi:hypothetical protein